MTTQLEVLNHVLSVVGEDPVSSANSTHPTAQTITNTINRVNKQFQLRGWWFNKEYALTINPDTQGQIILPSNTMKVDPTDTASALIKRGGKLYDPINHTYEINASVIVNLTLLLPIEELPESAGTYIMHKAAYDFYFNDDGDEEKSNRLLGEVNLAWAAVQSEQLQVKNINAKNRPAAAQLRAGIRQGGPSYNPTYPGGR